MTPVESFGTCSDGLTWESHSVLSHCLPSAAPVPSALLTNLCPKLPQGNSASFDRQRRSGRTFQGLKFVLFPLRLNGNPFQYSSLENSMERGAWQAIGYSPWGRKELDMTERLSLTHWAVKDSLNREHKTPEGLLHFKKETIFLSTSVPPSERQQKINLNPLASMIGGHWSNLENADNLGWRGGLNEKGD